MSETEQPESPEGQNDQGDPAEYDRFKDALRRIVSVPKEELDRREAEWQRQHGHKKKPKE